MILLVGGEVVFQLFDAGAQPQKLNRRRSGIEIVPLNTGSCLSQLHALQLRTACGCGGEQLLQHNDMLLLGNRLR